MGYSPELLTLQLSIRGVENVSLTETPFHTEDFGFTCRIPEISLKMERSAADLSSAPAEHTVTLIKKVCEPARRTAPQSSKAGHRHPDPQISAVIREGGTGS